MNVKRPEDLELVCAWINYQLGDDRRYVLVQPKTESQLLRENGHEVSDAVVLFNNLNHFERDALLAAMKNRGVIKCLTSINKLVKEVKTEVPKHQPHAHRSVSRY